MISRTKHVILAFSFIFRGITVITTYHIKRCIFYLVFTRFFLIILIILSNRSSVYYFRYTFSVKVKINSLKREIISIINIKMVSSNGHLFRLLTTLLLTSVPFSLRTGRVIGSTKGQFYGYFNNCPFSNTVTTLM